jgi:PAS domain S-box-containing protein
MVYEVSLIVASLISFTVAIYAWTRPYRPTTAAYAAVALAQGLWSLYWAIDPMTTGLQAKLILDHLAWMCGYVFVLLALRFALIYTGRSWSKRAWVVATLPAAFFVLASMTNEAFHLMYSATYLVRVPPYTYLGVEYTPVAWAAYLYSYAVIPIIVWLLVRHARDTNASFRAHTALIVAGMAIPSLFSIIGLVFPQTTASPAGSALNGGVYAAGTLLMAIGVFRVRAFRVAPIAHQFVFDRMSDAVIIVDTDQCIDDANPAARAFAPQGHGQIAGKTIAEAFPALAEELKGFDSADDINTRFACALNGQSQWFDLTIRTIEDRRGKPRGRLGVIRDVTEQVRLEELKVSEERLQVALQKERELNALKSKMMIRIAHEFRTPLSIISINGETLDKYIDRMSDERRHQKLDEMRRRIQQLAQILDNIITVAQNEYDFQDSPLTVFEVADLCYQCVEAEQIALAGNHRILIETTPHRIRANRPHLETILTNLLANAIRYSPDGSTIHLRQSFDQDDLLLQVTDEGIGISPDDLARIFEPFFRGTNTDDISGLGLGLSIVRDFVQHYGGAIAVESQPGQGTTFTVRLPNVAVYENIETEVQNSLPAYRDPT